MWRIYIFKMCQKEARTSVTLPALGFDGEKKNNVKVETLESSEGCFFFLSTASLLLSAISSSPLVSESAGQCFSTVWKTIQAQAQMSGSSPCVTAQRRKTCVSARLSCFHHRSRSEPEQINSCRVILTWDEVQLYFFPTSL